MNITKTLTSLSGKGRPISDTEMLKWANTTAQKAKPGVKPIRSFKDPSITTGLFFLDLLDAIQPGIVDPTLVINVSESGDYEDRRQNGKHWLGSRARDTASHPLLSCSEIGHFNRQKDECSDLLGPRGYRRRPPAPGMPACPYIVILILPAADLWLLDLDLRRKLDEHRCMMKLFPLYGHELGLQYVSVFGKQYGERKIACCTAMEYDKVRMNELFEKARSDYLRRRTIKNQQRGIRSPVTFTTRQRYSSPCKYAPTAPCAARAFQSTSSSPNYHHCSRCGMRPIRPRSRQPARRYDKVPSRDTPHTHPGKQ